jgi:hypothetical protein
MATDWNVDDMYRLGTKHAQLEARRDLEGVMATLVAEPEYEFWPAGLRMSGAAQVRRYYEHLFSWFIPRTISHELIAQWASVSAVAQEYRIDLDIDGARESHRVVGILYATGPLLGGERVYASERCMRRMVGDLFDDLVPL